MWGCGCGVGGGPGDVTQGVLGSMWQGAGCVVG